jgi:hypothetical protein
MIIADDEPFDAFIELATFISQLGHRALRRVCWTHGGCGAVILHAPRGEVKRASARGDSSRRAAGGQAV